MLTGEGFVLAGGKSSRMGEDKALLVYKGRTLLERAVDTLRCLGLKVTVITGAEDQFPRSGPLGGLYTALATSTSPHNYVLACDMPLLEPRFFELLSPYGHDFDAVVMRDSKGRFHPLCSYYALNCVNPIRQLLENGRRKVDEIFQADGIRSLVLDAPQMGVPDSFFFNVNTPDDFKVLSLIRT